VIPSAGASERLDGVAAVSSGDVWAVGSTRARGYDRALIEHWNGRAWQVVPAPDAGAGHTPLFGVAASAANDVWAVGHANATGTLIEHWDGISWKRVPSPSESRADALFAVAAVSPSDAWAVGTNAFQEGGRLYSLIEHWDGKGWTIEQSPAGEFSLTGIAATSPTDAWAVGGDAQTHRALIERWDGTKWRIVPSANLGQGSSFLAAIDAVSPSDVWAVGHATRDTDRALVEHWNGSRWKLLPSLQAGAGSGLAGVAARTANDVWAVGGSGGATAFHWDGARLQPVAVAKATESMLYAVVAIAADDVWSVGSASANGLLERYSCQHHGAP